MNTLTIIALIFIFLGGVGAILLTIGQALSTQKDKLEIISTTKSENTQLKLDLEEIRKERNLLNETLADRDAKIQTQNETIIDLSLKLSEKSEYIQNYLTGGSAFPFLNYLQFPQQVGQPRMLVFQLENNFDLPLYNITTNIFDYDKVYKYQHFDYNTQTPIISLKEYEESKVLTISHQEIPPKQFIAEMTTFEERQARYYIQTQARNGPIIQKIAVHKEGEGFYYGFQVFDSKGTLLKQDIKSDMPEEIQKKVLEKLNSIPNNMILQLNN